MALLERTHLGVRDYGTSVDVGSSPEARLSYYIDCILSLFEDDDLLSGSADMRTINKLRNGYKTSLYFTEDDKTALILLCLLLDPAELSGKVIFPSQDCGGSSNQFLEFTAVQTSMAVTEQVTVAGRNTVVRKVMRFTRSWLEQNYTEPMEQLRRRSDAVPTVAYEYNPYPQAQHARPYSTPLIALPPSDGRSRCSRQCQWSDKPYCCALGFVFPFLWFCGFCHLGKRCKVHNIFSSIMAVAFVLAMGIVGWWFFGTPPCDSTVYCGNDRFCGLFETVVADNATDAIGLCHKCPSMGPEANATAAACAAVTSNQGAFLNCQVACSIEETGVFSVS